MVLMGRPISLRLIILALLFFSLPSYYGVQGAGRSISASTEQEKDLDSQAQDRILNNPSTTKNIILTQEPDTFDCVDIYKQPAFNNPLLKKHRIQMRPSSFPRGSNYKTSSAKPQPSNGLKSRGCSDGMVPIRRPGREELVRSKSFSLSTIHPLTSTDGHYVTHMRSKLSVTKTFYGAQGDFYSWNPTVGSDQYSGAQLWLEAGPLEAPETIQAGWAVAPSIYGDNRTRLTVLWNSGSSVCINVHCPGFVQVDKEYVVGDYLGRISEYGGHVYALKLSVFQDKSSGNWFLQTIEDRIIGYWPKSLFKYLSQGAAHVAWGGLVKFTPKGPSPQMGSGKFPNGAYNVAAAISHLGTRHDFTDWYFDEDEFETYTEFYSCYRIEYDGMITPRQGYSLLYGGPGGNCWPREN